MLNQSTHQQAVESMERSGGALTLFWCLVISFSLTVAFAYKAVKRELEDRRKREAVDYLSNLTPQRFRTLLGDDTLPSFFKFPDYERAHFFNVMLEQLWPFVDLAVGAEIKKAADPLLKQSKPPFLGDISLSVFTLGTKAPTITGVKTYPQPQHKVKDVTVDLDFSWASNADVQLRVKPVPKHLGVVAKLPFSFTVGVQDVVLTGSLRLKFRPLLDSMPVVGAVHLSFVEVPSLTFSLRVFGTSISAIPGLDIYLDSFVRSQLMAYTLPEAYTIPLVPGDLSKLERPMGLIQVEVVECRELPRSDFFSRSSDPYCVLYVREKRKVRTDIKRSDRNPRFDKQFTFAIYDKEFQKLYVSVYDWDVWMEQDDELGHCEVPTSSLREGITEDLWLHLETKEERRKPPPGVITDEAAPQKLSRAPGQVKKKLQSAGEYSKGSIHLRITYLPIDDKILSTVEGSDQAAFGNVNRDSQSKAQEAQEFGRTVPAAAAYSPAGPLEDGGAVPEDRAIGLGLPRAPAAIVGGGGEADMVLLSPQAAQVVDGLPPVPAQRLDDEGGAHLTPGQKDLYRTMLKSGVLYITLKEATALRRKKPFLAQRWMFKVYIGEREQKARHKEESIVFTGRTREVNFANHRFEFMMGAEEYDQRENAVVQLELWEVRFLNQFAGYIQVPLADVIKEKRIDKLFTLSGASEGNVRIVLEWIPVTDT